MKNKDKEKNMRTKKLAAVLLAVVMTLCLLPTAAFAAEPHLVYLNDAWLDAGETAVGDGKVTLDVENKTLTIENVALTDFVSFEATEEFTLIVKGTNTITPESGSIGIGTNANLPALNIVLEEGASLDITADMANAIYIRGGDLKVSGAGSLTLTSSGGYPTLFAPRDITFDGVTVDITGDQVGIFCNEVYDEVEEDYVPTAVMMRNATVDIDVSAGDNQAIYCFYGSITVEDTVLTTVTSMEATDETENYGLYVDGDLLIKGDKTDVKHTGGIGFDADTITIEGGKVDVKSNDTALLGYSGVTISGGAVKAESTNSYAILGTKGTVSITGADTEVTAITGSEDFAAISNANHPDNPTFGDGGIHLDAKITVQGMNLIVGVKKDAEAAITLGENFEIAGATLKHESIGSSKTKTYFVDAEGNALTGEAVVCKHTYGETPTWTWAEDGSSATASFPCTASGDYTAVVNATITSETTPATCIAAGKTVYTAKATFGGKEYTSTKEIAIAIDADAHGETELKNAKDATCTEKGYTGDKVCKDCGKVAEAGTEIAIDADAHGETELKNAKDATCTEKGYTGDKVCKDCGKTVEAGTEIEMTAHTFEDGKCSVCGAPDPDYVTDTSDTSSEDASSDGSSDAASSDASSDADSSSGTPSTGDASALVWLVLAVVCIGGTVFVLRKRNA